VERPIADLAGATKDRLTVWRWLTRSTSAPAQRFWRAWIATVSPHRQHRKSAGERIAPISGIANVGAGRLPDGRVAVGRSRAGAGPDLG
jgi:hypothetical protein